METGRRTDHRIHRKPGTERGHPFAPAVEFADEGMDLARRKDVDTIETAAGLAPFEFGTIARAMPVRADIARLW